MKFPFTDTHACTHTQTDLHVPIEADSRNKHSIQALEGSRSVLLFVDVKSQSVLGQIQQDAHSRTLGDSSLRPTHKQTTAIIEIKWLVS